MIPEDRRIIAVFGSSQSRPGDDEYALGLSCGRLLAHTGCVVATGGYGGQMEAVSRGAADAGGSTIGITAPAVFPSRTGANQWVHRELPAAGLVQRIAQLTEVASGYIALPGSIGTLAELVVAWNLAFVAPFSGKTAPPIATVGDTWQTLVPLLGERLDSDASLIAMCATVDEAVAHVTASLQAER